LFFLLFQCIKKARQTDWFDLCKDDVRELTVYGYKSKGAVHEGDLVCCCWVDCFYAYFVEKYFLVKVLDFCSNWFVTTEVIEHLCKKNHSKLWKFPNTQAKQRISITKTRIIWYNFYFKKNYCTLILIYFFIRNISAIVWKQGKKTDLT
jgi:hypothetical protein